MLTRLTKVDRFALCDDPDHSSLGYVLQRLANSIIMNYFYTLAVKISLTVGGMDSKSRANPIPRAT